MIEKKETYIRKRIKQRETKRERMDIRGKTNGEVEAEIAVDARVKNKNVSATSFDWLEEIQMEKPLGIENRKRVSRIPDMTG